MRTINDILLSNFVGISDDLIVSSGYDETHPEASVTPEHPFVDALYHGAADVWSVADRTALADAMILRWERYRAALA